VFILVLSACLVWGLPPASADQGLIVEAPAAFSSSSAGDFWTPERMKQALQNPLSVSMEGESDALGIDALQPPAEPHSSPGYCPDCPEEASLPLPPTGTDMEAQTACPVSGYYSYFDTNYASYPQRVVGRLFFETVFGDLATCSASLVNRRMLLTAGHCVSGDGYWHKNFMWVPGYLNGDEPFGRAYAERRFTFNSWLNSEDFAHDVGMLLLKNYWGDQLGWLGFQTGLPAYAQEWWQFGYPAGEPYDGSTLVVNYSAYGYRDCSAGNPCTVGVGSPLTPGSSGGPWVMIADNAYSANGVNSYKYNNCDYNMHSPYFGADVWSLFEYVYAEQ
jgi:hypothetical protein